MMGNTRVCRSFTLVVRGPSLSFCMLCSLPNELNALAIHAWTLPLLELFSAMQEPTYVHSLPCSRLFLLRLMLRASCSLLMHIVCVFGALISIPYARLTELTESNRCCKSSADLASKAISSANCRLLNKWPPTSTSTPIVFSSASDIMCSI